MKLINLQAIYTLWLREMLRFFRMKSRVIGSLGMPFFFLAFLSMGFDDTAFLNGDLDYTSFLTPGIIGMLLLFSSTFTGISVLWDKEFGFLKEIMVTPVSRISILIGRIAGGATTAIMEALIILVLSVPLGFNLRGIYGDASTSGIVIGVVMAFVFMVLIATTFIALGIAFASCMEDMSGYSIIMNFVIFPLFFLSGALFPIDNFPSWVRILALLDPLTYGVDGLRGCLTGAFDLPLLIDLFALVLSSLIMLVLGSYLFKYTEVD
ncbi:MAG: multidrug ABC transporter permease [Candidatus Syntrophoarchaeum caldarius]|uniref:Multidrug ABC transporter permease n=1 Tax=Candidatus Syntropharchaeum caldarium TaxID=1838285 RepID=A0A1F2P856_9EURY|nr:MAG: multidrug ABC transporter permease [Candidatus Syntrophoarchaeum caldarius]